MDAMIYSVEVPGRFYDCRESSIVYFDLQTGDTHLVNNFTAHVIRVLADHPMDFNRLIENLASDVEAEDRSSMAEVLPGILDELISLNMIVRE